MMIISDNDRIIKKFEEDAINVEIATSIIKKVADEFDKEENLKFLVKITLWGTNKNKDQYYATGDFLEHALNKALKLAYASYIFDN